MDRKTLQKEIGRKLEDIREPLKYTHLEMAERIGANKSTYTRYETGERSPRITTLYSLGKTFDVSLDWLVCGKGPMYYREKEIEKRVEEEAKAREARPETAPGKERELRQDVEELLGYMEQIPLLRYEVLVLFHKFKEERKDMVADAMTDKKQE